MHEVGEPVAGCRRKLASSGNCQSAVLANQIPGGDDQVGPDAPTGGDPSYKGKSGSSNAVVEIKPIFGSGFVSAVQSMIGYSEYTSNAGGCEGRLPPV